MLKMNWKLFQNILNSIYSKFENTVAKDSQLIPHDTDFHELSYGELLKEGAKAGSSDHTPKILGISGGAVSAVTGTLAILGEEFGEELLGGLGGGAFIGIGFMIYKFFRVAKDIEDEFANETETD